MNVDMASGGCSTRLHWMVPYKLSIEQCSLQYQSSKVGSEHMSSSNKWLGAPTNEPRAVIRPCLPICSPPLSSQSSLTWRHTETKKEWYNHFKHLCLYKVFTIRSCINAEPVLASPLLQTRSHHHNMKNWSYYKIQGHHKRWTGFETAIT